MRKLIIIIFVFASFLTYSQETSSFFNDKTFQLQHFIINGEVKELDLINPNDPSGNTSRGIPIIQFIFDDVSNTLEASIVGYCNSTSATYKIHDSYLEVLNRGGTTLSDCGGDEETDYFTPVTGNSYLQQPTQNVNYTFSEDKIKLTFWLNENHKLVFREHVLSTEKNQLQKLISVYPNPIQDDIYIYLKPSIQISEISLFDYQGRKILEKQKDFSKIDISKLAKGIYILKIKNQQGLFVSKKIIKK